MGAHDPISGRFPSDGVSLKAVLPTRRIWANRELVRKLRIAFTGESL